MKKFILLFATLISLPFASFSQEKSAPQKREKYEFVKNLPAYAEKIMADWTFPLAWGNSEIKDFELWRKTARKKVFDCMLTPPPPASDYDVKILAEEQREGYRVKKIEVRLCPQRQGSLRRKDSG